MFSENDQFLKLALIGLVSLLIIQTFIHIGVNIRLFPTTGMTLPFLSYGGSSLIGSSIVSGLILNKDFYLGYSPERINPGDKEHRITNIIKVTSGSTDGAAEYVDKLYQSIITAGTYKASSIKVAEAAKVIENTQRDINIALIN